MPNNGKCSVCHKPYAYVRQHERLRHGIYQGRGKKHSTALAKIEPKQEPENTIRVIQNVEVVTDGKRIGIVEWIR